MLIIKQGRVIDPASGADSVTDIAVEGGRIAAIGPGLAPGAGGRVLDAAGLVVAPGFVDTHVHFRDPGFTHKEDLHTGSLAAARGGYTTVVCMANVKPVADNLQVLSEIKNRAKGESVNILQAACVSLGMEGKAITDMEELHDFGAALFSDDGLPIRDAGLLLSAMKRAAALGAVISLHEEDPSLLAGSGVNEGDVSRRMGVLGAASVAEDSLVARDCMLALETGARVIIQHISTARAIAMVRFARSLGARVDAEATPHHFSLNELSVTEKGTMAKMNPPLRTQTDRLAVIEGLKDGTVNLIATDHAPHHADEKALPFEKAPSGIIGLETALALGIGNLVAPGHLTLAELMRKMSANPAKILGLDAGTLRVGGPADIVIFDPEKKWTVDRFASKSANSPFIGETLTGRVEHTICRGEIVYTVTE